MFYIKMHIKCIRIKWLIIHDQSQNLNYKNIFEINQNNVFWNKQWNKLESIIYI